jgi:uncharacterized membrane protein
MFKIIKDIIRRQFLSGVLVVVPLILTYVVLRFLFENIDGIMSPVIERVFGYHVPGLGIITTILIIILTGFFTCNLVGAKIYKMGDKVLTRTPLIRIFYLAAKQLIEAITMPNVNSFKEVVMIEYPRKGTYALGFATARIKMDETGSTRLIGVFVPSTPTPVSGIVVFVPENDVIHSNLTIEEGIKMIVSGGIVTPRSIMAEEESPV